MTTLKRRRFLKLSVATSATMLAPISSLSAVQEPVIWTGFVLGAEASIKVYGDQSNAERAIEKALLIIRKYEKELSIYDPDSLLSELNEAGVLHHYNGKGLSIRELVAVSKLIANSAEGLFDPTIQPLFEAYTKSKDMSEQAIFEIASSLVDINKVDVSRDAITSFRRKGMSLTFNGIAQGYITDKVRNALDRLGYKEALINIGEYSAGDRQARIGIADTNGEIFDIETLSNQAIATSSPASYLFADGTSHILHPNGIREKAVWDTVSVVAKNATLADGYSTALALTKDTKMARKLVTGNIIQKVIFKDQSGKIHTINS